MDIARLLRECVKLTLENVENQSSLLSNKNVGYAAEWATWKACGGKGDGFIKSTLDPRISSAYGSATVREKREFQSLYEKMLEIAMPEVEVENPGLPIHTPDAASTTEKVDVPCKNADIHVKFNDANRLAGFQRAHRDVPSSETTVIYDKVMEQFGTKLSSSGKMKFIDSSGFLRRPAGVKGQSKMTGIAKRNAEKLEMQFQAERDAYREYFTINPGRTKFIHALKKEGIESAIINDVTTQLMGGSGRPALFFKYFTSGKNVTLQVHNYSLGDLLVVPIIDKETTIFYKVTDNEGKKVYFLVEFRMDGGGHPPQLKVGPDLDVMK
jgi:hypothetical protein